MLIQPPELPSHSRAILLEPPLEVANAPRNSSRMIGRFFSAEAARIPFASVDHDNYPSQPLGPFILHAPTDH